MTSNDSADAQTEVRQDDGYSAESRLNRALGGLLSSSNDMMNRLRRVLDVIDLCSIREILAMGDAAEKSIAELNLTVEKIRAEVKTEQLAALNLAIAKVRAEVEAEIEAEQAKDKAAAALNRSVDDDLLDREIRMMDAEGFVGDRWQRCLSWLRELQTRRTAARVVADLPALTNLHVGDVIDQEDADLLAKYQRAVCAMHPDRAHGAAQGSGR